MGVKADAPKLTAAERLARKRAAARLRQQRCRARKRQAMLEKKREEVARQRCAKLAHGAPRPQVVMRAVQHPPRSLFPTYKPVHLAEVPGAPWVNVRGKGPASPPLMKPTSEPIYNCVSFDSTKSLEEAQQQKIARANSSPPRSPAQTAPKVVTPTNRPPSPGKPATVTRTLSDEKAEESLVPEEEAAVAAMLSLKSGSTSPTAEKSEQKSKEPPLLPSQSPPREVVISHKPTSIHASTGPGGMKLEQLTHQTKNGVRSLPPRRMVPRLHDYEVYTYGHPMKFPPHPRRAQVPPAYYRVHAPVPPPHPHYARYHYPPAPRFVKYEYE